MSLPTAGIVTAVYDGYDKLRRLPYQDIDIDAVCVTDDPHLRGNGWRMVYEPRPGVHPNRAAKWPKCCPWLYTEAPVSIWIDALFEVQSGRFARDAIAYVSDEQPISQYVHPNRDCLYTEAAVSVPIMKYRGEPIAEQAEHYRSQGHPEHWGLWEAGCTVRVHTDEIERFGVDWLAEIDRWSFQDQVSLPFVLRNHGLRPTSLPRNSLGIAMCPSARHATG